MILTAPMCVAGFPSWPALVGAVVHEPPPGAYAAPIVDHREARARALNAYREASRVHDPGG